MKQKANGFFFIDDDALVEQLFFERFLQLIKDSEEIVVIGGPNLTPLASTHFQRASGYSLASHFGSYVSSARYASRGKLRNCGEESLILCGLFIKRTALQQFPFPQDFICCDASALRPRTLRLA